LVTSLRQHGFTGAIDLIGDEPWLPYHRPPLSKTFLADDKRIEDVLIRPAQAYEKADITTRLSTRVTAIDPLARTVTLQDGTALPASHIVIATGGVPRRLPLPGADLEGVYVLRSAADVHAIKKRVSPGGSAVIIGGGYIGLETSASLRKLGLSVTLLEAEERVLARVTGPKLSSFYQRIHGEEGVDILTGAMAVQIDSDTQVTGVSLKDGRQLPADLVIMGVGISPSTSLAANAGLDVDDGILVDEHCQTSAAHIYAIGDCARQFHPLYQRSLRLESIQNATDQAKACAAAICGKPKPRAALPWFWSDQYDLKLQIAGLSQGFDDIVIRGKVEEGRSFAAFYFKAGKLLACDAINRPMEFMVAKKLLAEGTSVDPIALADESTDIKALLHG
jgi:3-phenylpropionate/trans-cinnamate dioxygenase ferredoxin reductase subunit